MAIDDDEMVLVHPVELSQRELILIGFIIAQWGGMEHEIFVQTLRCFDEQGSDELPKAMNNAQFSQVLDLWELQVVEKSEGKRRDVLRKQLFMIRQLAEHRHALAHGMWDYDKAKPDRITAIRILKKQIISHQFTADDLEDFSKRLGVINFRIRHPLGIEDLAKAAEKSGGYMSRAAVAMLSGHPIAKELMPEIANDKLAKLNDDNAT